MNLRSTLLAFRGRDHSDWLLKELHAHDVPLLIFSAGLGDIIEEVIRQQYTMYDNIHIVSNYMDFNNKVRAAL